MKKLRKLVVLLLAVTMLMSLGVVAAAEQTVTTSGGGNNSILIENATVGQTYKVYKIFDLTTADDGNGNTTYAYKVVDAWKGFFTGSGTGASYVDIDSNGYVTWKSDVKTDTATMQTLASALKSYAESNTKTISAIGNTTATDTQVKFTSLTPGYYFVTSTLGTLVTIDTVSGSSTTVTVSDKNGKPYITKEVSDTGVPGSYGTTATTAGITDTVYYQITITEFNETTVLTLHDALPAGFTYNSDITVKFYDDVGDTSPDTLTNGQSNDYTIATSGLGDGCSLEVYFSNLLSSSTYTITEDSILVVTYSATVDKDKVSSIKIGTSEGNINTAWLTHSGTDTAKQYTTTYVYDFYVYKYTGTDTALAGAKFTLQRSSDSYYATFGTDSDGDYYLTGWQSIADDSTSYITSDSNGLIHVYGLDAGTYTLTETAAPTNGTTRYVLLTEPISVVINSDGTVSNTSSVSDGQSGTVSAIKVYNSVSEEMPATGGIGTTIFYIIGGILVVGAVILIITRKRMRIDEA